MGSSEYQPRNSGTCPGYCARAFSIRLSRLAGSAPEGAAASSGSAPERRSEEHTSELQSLMRISYAVFCLNKKILDRVHLRPTPVQSPDTNTTLQSVH